MPPQEQLLMLMQDQMQLVVSSNTPLCAHSILLRLGYTPYGMPQVVSQLSVTMLKGIEGQTRETICLKIEELTR